MKNEINHKNNHPAASHDSDGSKIGNRLNIYGKRTHALLRMWIEVGGEMLFSSSDSSLLLLDFPPLPTEAPRKETESI